MRYQKFNEGGHYRVMGRSVGTEKIFIDDTDRARFVFLILYFQSPIQLYNTSWYTKRFMEKGSFMANENKTNDILRKRNIILTAFNISEQNFDLIIKNLEDGILSVYMHRVLTAYSKYFNKKYNKKGHVFAGPFEATLINSKDLDSMSTEIHKKPTNYREYPWSSYQDYTKENRWGDLLIVPKALQK